MHKFFFTSFLLRQLCCYLFSSDYGGWLGNCSQQHLDCLLQSLVVGVIPIVKHPVLGKQPFPIFSKTLVPSDYIFHFSENILILLPQDKILFSQKVVVRLINLMKFLLISYFLLVFSLVCSC